MTEHNIQQQIRLHLSKLNYIVLRLNVGRFYTLDGRPINTGLPVGCSDLLAISPTGQAVFIECKTDKGRPTEEQLNFISAMRKQGCIAGVCRSVDDVNRLLTINDSKIV